MAHLVRYFEGASAYRRQSTEGGCKKVILKKLTGKEPGIIVSA